MKNNIKNCENCGVKNCQIYGHIQHRGPWKYLPASGKNWHCSDWIDAEVSGDDG